mmetsp:Transcript_41990/g.75639  ORF Transcript_41990/g.75639 Transcript_41990/m.75639 type:complete len:156 (-) Transcript_41990:189-656(-)|eukprot:CAMPEP_0201884740 /NCGR_PEP_ID=MMETSP0902-20130614/17531_1 /ASSEMBLY_ACC=CAM_ASM_000551 /TAXON_ID=420261 /ORGANISM="Thalassiosira antarctica, Strain CCMP982" /LENGTH=155 /DNA_ID=CAMNT_0048413747 /DNA_START=161 /DNA_END=628 /DNA_ORIENTATION=-
MIDISFLQKITSSPKRPAGKRRWKSIDGCGKKNPVSQTKKTHEQIEAEHRHFLSNQILRISSESYDQGVIFLNDKKYDDARECFEDALAARLVRYGPEDACILEVHGNLRRIAYIQGDATKAARHEVKISHIQSVVMSNKMNNHHDTVDWSVLCK